MNNRPDTDEEIVTAALLLGAKFIERTRFTRRNEGARLHAALGPTDNASLCWHYTARDAAVGFLIRNGFHLNFDGQLSKD